ncbi:MAG: S41 family peptidase [bacterium]|nr:S41 family peptidase [bacterium]
MLSKKTLPLILIAAILVGGSFYAGYQRGTQSPEQFIVKGITNIGDDDVEADFGIFWETWKKIISEHIDGADIDDKSLVYGATRGLVNSLDDQNSVFFPPMDSKKFNEDISGSFGGIGAEIGIRNSQLIIVAPLKNSPAERAGLRSGDKILQVDDEPTDGLDVMEAVKIIRGLVGDEVVLTIMRDSWSGPKEIAIVREVIKIPTLDLDIVDGLAHVRLYSFNEVASNEFRQAILESVFAGAQGIILDLRNNPGGFLEVAVDIAGWFLNRGDVVVTEEFRSGDKEVFRASGNISLEDATVVILVNGGSASASEILAGALRDHKGYKLVGEKTFGKGTVQQVFPLRDGSSVKLTVAHWLLPSGKLIEKNGLEPDFMVEFSEKDVELKNDPQLDKAKEVLREEISKAINS